jgi:nitrate reductase gamma subunit
MSLLEFARGPAMQLALVIFVAGICWRLVGVALLRGSRDLSEPRRTATWKGLRAIALRFWSRREFRHATLFGMVTGYVFHVGFLLVLFFYVPHILFFRDLLPGFLGAGAMIGASWPALPTPIVSVLAALSLAALVVLLSHRRLSPVKRLISNFDDYFSWLVTAAPLATGLAAAAHVSLFRYETLLAAHLLAVAALLIWFPWGKLMHAFTVFAARGATGMLFERKGAAL